MPSAFFNLAWVLLLFSCLSSIAECEKKLKFVHALWRHGDRAPSKKPYPLDPYDERYWPRGWNQLTNLGMRQMNELGKYFRERYGNWFISEKHNYKEVYIQSSEADRALVSAQAFLQGMYPPLDEADQFQTGLNWQPIAVHSTGVDVPDPLLKPTSFDCPAYDEYVKPLMDKLDEQMSQRYRSLFDFLGNATGFGPKITFHDVAKVSNIQKELDHNLTQPAWAYKRWEEYENKTTLDIVTEIRRIERIAEFNSTNLGLLRGGYLLGDWLRRIKKVAEGNNPKVSKMVLYSAHEGTLMSLLYATELLPGETVEYAGCLIMELYQLEDGTFEVELLFRREDNVEKLVLGGCEYSCPLERVLTLLKRNTILKETGLYKECRLKDCDVSPISLK
ncbi:histidine phosphatase superfamily (branch 2) domain-containing protein [Ditylenchus destructor]|nr:histidine phosphatase superfamily (branch 2) domain-containing protein [Ditylenchus destructor]